MAKLIENKEEIEKVILVAVSLDDSNDADESLDELEELVIPGVGGGACINC